MNVRTCTDQLMGKLRQYRGSYRQIAALEPELDYSWLAKFANGRMPNPTVGKLEALERALAIHERSMPARGAA